jgi:hypothetical protein
MNPESVCYLCGQLRRDGHSSHCLAGENEQLKQLNKQLVEACKAVTEACDSNYLSRFISTNDRQYNGKLGVFLTADQLEAITNAISEAEKNEV